MNNEYLSLQGVGRFYKRNKKHVITTQTVRLYYSVLTLYICTLSFHILSLIALKFCYVRLSNFLPITDFIFFCPQEHKCVLDSCRALESEGFEVTYLPVRTNGLIDMQVCYRSTQIILQVFMHNRKRKQYNTECENAFNNKSSSIGYNVLCRCFHTDFCTSNV